MSFLGLSLPGEADEQLIHCPAELLASQQGPQLLSCLVTYYRLGRVLSPTILNISQKVLEHCTAKVILYKG